VKVQRLKFGNLALEHPEQKDVDQQWLWTSCKYFFPDFKDMAVISKVTLSIGELAYPLRKNILKLNNLKICLAAGCFLQREVIRSFTAEETS